MKLSVCASYCNNHSDPVVYFQSNNFWKTQYARAICRDCGNENIHLWKNTSHPSWHMWNLADCKTHDIQVDETKSRIIPTIQIPITHFILC